MEAPQHSLSDLFAQLGQAGDEAAIAAFVAANPPLGNGIQLHEAPYWSAVQAGFLREAIGDDGDWAQVADALNSRLHARH
jgi:hypothetical protein